MNAAEAKKILLLYRPGTADADDPEFAGALALAKCDPELSLWFEMHCARHEALRAKFRQITPPPALKEQIISEYAATTRSFAPPRTKRLLALVSVLIILLGISAFVWLPQRTAENTFAIYQNDMAGWALRNYGMNLVTNDLASIRSYLAAKEAPSDFKLPAGLAKAELGGCAIDLWSGQKVSMICFLTGKPLEPGAPADLWLIVTDRSLVKDAPASSVPKFTKVNRLMTASWSDGKKLYFLGVVGSEDDLRRYL